MLSQQSQVPCLRCLGWHTWNEPWGHTVSTTGAQGWAEGEGTSQEKYHLSFEEPIGAYWSTTILLLTIHLNINFLWFLMISLEQIPSNALLRQECEC